MAGEVGDAISGAGAGAAIGGGFEGRLGSAVTLGPENLGAAPPLPELTSPADLQTDAAAEGLVASLEPNLDVDPGAGIQTIAHADVPAEAPAVAEPGADASTGPTTTPGTEAPTEAAVEPVVKATAEPEAPVPAETAIPEAAIPLSPTDQQELNDLSDKELREDLTADEHIRKAELANGPKTDTGKPADTAAPDVIRVGEPNDIVASPEDVAAKGAAAEAAAPVTPEAPATPATPENAARTARKQELEGKLSEGQPLTLAEKRELRDLNRNPEQVRAGLEQKMKDGTATDEDLAKLDEIEGSEAASKLTPEQQAEKLKQDKNKLGEELMNKATNGETITPEDLERFQKLSGQEALIDRGFSPEDAKAAMERVGGNKAGGERQARQMNELKGKIQELMALEMQILAIPKRVEELRKQRDEAKKVADEKHSQVNAATTPEQRLQRRGEEANEYMKIANINGVIIGQRNVVPILEARIADTEQYIRRKAGVTGGLTALMEFGGAKVRVAVEQVRAEVGDEVAYRTGNY